MRQRWTDCAPGKPAAEPGLAADGDWPPYRGFAPIATCHWQCIANIFALYGMPRPLCLMNPSWGIRWRGGVALYGAGTWRLMLRTLLDATVREHTAQTSAEAADIELAAAGAGLLYVAEVDAWYLLSPYQHSEHVVHTIVVAALAGDAVTIIDPMNNPVPLDLPLPLYQRMRAHPCAGRLEPYKLYIPEPGPYRNPPLTEIAGAVRDEVAAQAEPSLRDLADFIEWIPEAREPADVCRVAGERHQAGLLFDLLAAQDAGVSRPTAAAMTSLRDDWYMLHMLTTHERAHEPRHRHRVSRMLGELLAGETAFAAMAGAS